MVKLLLGYQRRKNECSFTLHISCYYRCNSIIPLIDSNNRYFCLFRCHALNYYFLFYSRLTACLSSIIIYMRFINLNRASQYIIAGFKSFSFQYVKFSIQLCIEHPFYIYFVQQKHQILIETYDKQLRNMFKAMYVICDRSFWL